MELEGIWANILGQILVESGLTRHKLLIVAAVAAFGGPSSDVGNVLADGCPDLDCGFLSWMVLWEAIWEEK